MHRYLVALCLLVLPASASAQWAQRPPLTHRHDDRSVTFGNTQATPDFRLQWDTADPSDHHLALDGIAGSTGDFVLSWDPDTDWGVTNGNRFRIQSTDATSPTEWLGLKHDGTDGVIESGSGDVVVASAGGQVDVAATGASSLTVNFNTSTTSVGAILATNTSQDQTAIFVRDSVGRQLVLSDWANFGKDHDHAVPTNPTLYVHSATDPDSDNTQWLSLAHNATDAVVVSGKGQLSLRPATYLQVDPGTNTDGVVTLVGEAVASGNQTVTCLTFTPPASTGWTIEASAMGYGQAGPPPKRAGYKIIGTFGRGSVGNTTQVGATTAVHTAESDAAWDAVFLISGDEVRFNVTTANYAGAETTNWGCSYRMIESDTP